MTASRPRARAAAAGGLAAAALACAGPTGLPAVSAIDRRAELPALVPDVADHTAVRLAAAALASRGPGERAEVERALASLEAIDTVLAAAEERRTGLVPAARDLANASLGDQRAYRIASEALLEGDLDPALEERLEQSREDDLLELADARVRDARRIAFAQAFNALAEPAGRSMTNWTMAPYRFGQAAVEYAIALYRTEPLPLQRRQALAHWKEYLERYPGDPRAEELAGRVRDAQARWNRTHYERAMRVARRELEAGRPRMSLVYADRALRLLPEDERASDLRDRAERDLEAERERLRRSLAAPGALPAPDVGARALALALLAPGGDVESGAAALLAREPEGPLADEARFARATAAAEAGRERGACDELRELADGDTNMARHAAALLGDPLQNAYDAFRAARREGRWSRLRFALLGPWANGPPSRGLPRWVEWPLGVPALGQATLGLPLRIAQLPWLDAPAADAAAARSARRYLERHPEGERAGELRGWLLGFEEGRGNWLGALALAEQGGGDPERLRELRERAAEQSLQMALGEPRPGLRLAMLQRVAREFQGTAASTRAGLLAREETLRATPQRIRLSRGFLRENPEVAGISGLALRPPLLDGEAANGELHPEGVSLIGGLEIEISLVAASGDEQGEPERRIETLREEHLARVVALLEETSFRNSLLDPDDALAPDARRDRFFEQARLGRAEVTDPRPGAASEFAYLGMRERYGLVRGRESILPFDLVLQGSFDDLSLGAFPRMRMPRETPDAIFYR